MSAVSEDFPTPDATEITEGQIIDGLYPVLLRLELVTLQLFDGVALISNFRSAGRPKYSLGSIATTRNRKGSRAANMKETLSVSQQLSD